MNTMSSAQLERETEECRAKVEQTMGQLKAKLTPGQLVDELLAHTKDGGGRFVSNPQRVLRFDSGRRCCDRRKKIEGGVRMCRTETDARSEGQDRHAEVVGTDPRGEGRGRRAPALKQGCRADCVSTNPPVLGSMPGYSRVRQCTTGDSLTAGVSGA